MNPLFCTDSYKLSHKGFMTDGTQLIYSNLTMRNMKYLPVLKHRHDGKSVNFGTQGVLKQMKALWDNHFFNLPKEQVIAEAKEFFDLYLGPDAVCMAHFEQLHDFGFLPIQVKALPEGARVNAKVPVLTIHNTHKDFAWLTNYLETWLSAQLWKQMTVATIAYEYRSLANEFALKTTGSTAGTEFQIHDFSYRGMSGTEDAAMAGAAFLLSSCGTDNIPGVYYATKFYGANMKAGLIGTSVPASEHSLASTGIAVTGELETYRKWITQDYPTGIVSVIADTLDFFRVITEFATELKDDILNRQPNAIGLAKVVFRPDCYDEQTKILTDKGWKYFKDLTPTCKVAQVLDDGSYEFVQPLKIVDQPYTGTMIKYSDTHGKIDLLVTPNHRMVLEQKNIRTNQWNERIVEAEKLGTVGKKGSDKQRLIRSAHAKNKGRSLAPIERLKIAFQADGSYVTKSNTAIRFSFAKDRKKDRLRSILQDCNLEYEVYDLSDGKVEFNIKVGNNSIYRKDFHWVDTSDLCSNWCREFVEELSYWDASRRSDERFKFDTTNAEVVPALELICLSAGYGVLVSERSDGRSEKFNNVFTLHIMKDKYIGGQARHKEEEEYSGRVYCVQVPTGRVLVKRGRGTVVCGNSGDPVKILTGWKVLTDEVINNSNVDSFERWFTHLGYEALEIKGKVYPWVNGQIDKTKELSDAERKGAVQCLWEIFGGTTTEQGYKQLHERVGLIYGDSITLERAEQILERLKNKGFASTNVVFGIGSYTCQYLTRDSMGIAVKATAAVVNGQTYELSKDPVTDDGTKKSAKGLLRVEKEGNDFVLYDMQTWLQEDQGELRTVFKDGELINLESFETIRSRLWN